MGCGGTLGSNRGGPTANAAMLIQCSEGAVEVTHASSLLQQASHVSSPTLSNGGGRVLSAPLAILPLRHYLKWPELPGPVVVPTLE